MLWMACKNWLEIVEQFFQRNGLRHIPLSLGKIKICFLGDDLINLCHHFKDLVYKKQRMLHLPTGRHARATIPWEKIADAHN